MGGQHGTVKIEQLLAAIEKVLVAVKKISADGKVGLSDLPHLLDLLQEANVVIAGLRNSDEAVGEAKELDAEEAKKVLQAFYDLEAKVRLA